MRILTPGTMVFLTTLAVLIFCLNGVWAADHPTSLLELAYAVWARHSVVLGRVGFYDPGTVDDFAINGNYYSALAPGGPFLSLPLVGIGFAIDGKFNVFGQAMFFSELFVSLCNAIAAYLVYKLGSMFFSEKTSAFVAFAYAFSTISWPFATFFFESDVSAMLDLLGVYLAVRAAKRGSARPADMVGSGGALAAALTVDYLNILLVPVVGAFLLYRFRKELPGFVVQLAEFLLSAGVGVLLIGLYNQVAFGNPLTTTEQAYRHASSVFGSFNYPILSGLYLDLFSPMRGIFVYCPILVFGVVGFYIMSTRREMASVALLLAGCFMALLIPYSMWYDAAGGEGFGQRFLIPVIPFLLLPSGFVIESRRRGGAVVVYLFYLVGAFFNGVSAVTTAIPQVEAVSQFPFLVSVLPTFLRGALDVWWLHAAGSLWRVAASLVIATAMALPLSTGAVSWRRRRDAVAGPAGDAKPSESGT